MSKRYHYHCTVIGASRGEGYRRHVIIRTDLTTNEERIHHVGPAYKRGQRLAPASPAGLVKELREYHEATGRDKIDDAVPVAPQRKHTILDYITGLFK